MTFRSYDFGSSRSSIDSAIVVAQRTLRDSQTDVHLLREGDDLVVQIAAVRSGAVGSTARLLLAVAQDLGKVSIGRGENASRSATYRNIVRSLRQIGTWTGGASTVRLSKMEFAVAGSQSIVVLLQNGAGGPILAAGQLRIVDPSLCLPTRSPLENNGYSGTRLCVQCNLWFPAGE
jgi:hypothetical protein